MFQVGDTLDQYQLTAEIGTGSYGRVFAAENAVTHQRFALKVVPLAGNAGRRELHALELYRDLDHPNLLKIHHVGRTEDFLYYTMDLADGKLADQRLSIPELLDAAIKLADALGALHAAGLLHRDIKPDNLLWRGGEPLLGDIGLLTQESQATFTGTAGFLSPRIWKDGLPPDENTDLYAFAKSFYCLLSGNPPRRYPDYRGEMTPEASRLIRMSLLICDGEKNLSTAAKVRDFLRGEIKRHVLPRRIVVRRLVRIIALALIAALVVFGIYFGIYRPLKTRPPQMSEEEKRYLEQEETFKRYIERQRQADEFTRSLFPRRFRESDEDRMQRNRAREYYLRTHQ